MSLITIVVADDHPILCQGLKALLEARTGFRVIGTAHDGLQAVRLVEQLQPNVLVADLMMPALNGLEVIRQVRRLAPKTRVVILSMHANEAYLQEALKNGASGYILKEATSGELIKAITEVMAGRRYLSRPFADFAVEAYLEKAKGAPLDRYETLTPREREVLQLAAEGNTSSEIARRLFTSPRTVEVHRAHLMRKLGLRTAADLIRYAINRGILPVDPNP